MTLADFFESEFDEHEKATRATREMLRAQFLRLADICIETVQDNNKIIFFGNGGSAADAQHLAAELVVRYKVNRQPIRSLALTADTAVLTAGANDFGYETVFERQVQALGSAGDVAIALTTSGNSPNVVKGLEAAREMGMVPTALAGKDGGRLVGLADPLLIVPSDTIARIQEMHILLGHMLCDIVEQHCGKEA